MSKESASLLLWGLSVFNSEEFALSTVCSASGGLKLNVGSRGVVETSTISCMIVGVNGKGEEGSGTWEENRGSWKVKFGTDCVTGSDTFDTGTNTCVSRVGADGEKCGNGGEYCASIGGELWLWLRVLLSWRGKYWVWIWELLRFRARRLSGRKGKIKLLCGIN